VWAWIIGGLVTLLALDSEHGRDKAKSQVKLGPDGKPEKVKGPDDWKAEGRKEAEETHKAEREREKQLRAVIRREMRYRPPARAAAGSEEPDA
jgi:hypothetical protein